MTTAPKYNYTFGVDTPRRKSKQRERILELLHAKRHHVSAGWVYGRLRLSYPHASLGNVYRNLGILVEEGRARKVAVGGGEDLFEAVREEHAHLVCTACKRIEDLPLEEALWREINESARRVERFDRVDDVLIYSLCSDCAASAETAEP